MFANLHLLSIGAEFIRIYEVCYCFVTVNQNLNESVNSVIWTRLPKTVFVQISTLRFGVYNAILCFNDRVSKKQEVLKVLGVDCGEYTRQSLLEIDRDRIRKTDIAALSCTKEARQKKKTMKEGKKTRMIQMMLSMVQENINWF